jgi:hypothetical protein
MNLKLERVVTHVMLQWILRVCEPQSVMERFRDNDEEFHNMVTGVCLLFAA